MPPKESPLAMTNVLRATSRVMLGCTVFVLGLGLVGCGSDGGNSGGGDGGVAGDTGGGTGQAPVFRNRVEMDDTALATAALDVINNPDTGCAQCHGITRQTIRHWRALTDTVVRKLRARVDARRGHPGRGPGRPALPPRRHRRRRL
jgi:hypothetical protein